MSNLVTRNYKGAPLTNYEVDSNFTNLLVAIGGVDAPPYSLPTPTGSGGNVLSNSPTFTGTFYGDTLNLSADLTVSGSAIFTTTASLKIPTGTTAQRPGIAGSGDLRFNTSLTQYEGYNGSVWGTIGGGATGGPGDSVFYENSQDVTQSYNITIGKNAMCTGPITINTGVTLNVPTGSRLVVI